MGRILSDEAYPPDHPVWGEGWTIAPAPLTPNRNEGNPTTGDDDEPDGDLADEEKSE